MKITYYLYLPLVTFNMLTTVLVIHLIIPNNPTRKVLLLSHFIVRKLKSHIGKWKKIQTQTVGFRVQPLNQYTTLSLHKELSSVTKNMLNNIHYALIPEGL